MLNYRNYVVHHCAVPEDLLVPLTSCFPPRNVFFQHSCKHLGWKGPGKKQDWEFNFLVGAMRKVEQWRWTVFADSEMLQNVVDSSRWLPGDFLDIILGYYSCLF